MIVRDRQGVAWGSVFRKVLGVLLRPGVWYLWLERLGYLAGRGLLRDGAIPSWVRDLTALLGGLCSWVFFRGVLTFLLGRGIVQGYTAQLQVGSDGSVTPHVLNPVFLSLFLIGMIWFLFWGSAYLRRLWTERHDYVRFDRHATPTGTMWTWKQVSTWCPTTTPGAALSKFIPLRGFWGSRSWGPFSVRLDTWSTGLALGQTLGLEKRIYGVSATSLPGGSLSKEELLECGLLTMLLEPILYPKYASSLLYDAEELREYKTLWNSAFYLVDSACCAMKTGASAERLLQHVREELVRIAYNVPERPITEIDPAVVEAARPLVMPSDL